MKAIELLGYSAFKVYKVFFMFILYRTSSDRPTQQCTLLKWKEEVYAVYICFVFVFKALFCHFKRLKFDFTSYLEKCVQSELKDKICKHPSIHHLYPSICWVMDELTTISSGHQMRGRIYLGQATTHTHTYIHTPVQPHTHNMSFN